MRAAIIALFTAILAIPAYASACYTKDTAFLYVATFNVFKLGGVDDKYKNLDSGQSGTDAIPERVSNLADVIAFGEFDLVAIQEIHEGARGQAVGVDLLRALKEQHQLDYEFVLSDGIGRGLIPEAIMLLYDPDRVTFRPYQDGAETKIIELPGRDFVSSRWVAGDFDFTLISAHFAFGNEEHRKADFNKLEEILLNTGSFSDDPDILFAADTNRFGDGQESVNELAWDPGRFFAPNITFFDPNFSEIKQVTKRSIAGKDVPGDDPQLISTTVAKNTFAYDIILFSADAAEEFSGDPLNPTYGEDFGIIHFDQANGCGFQDGADELNHNDLKVAISDHRPTWLRFKMNAGTLDGP